MESCFAGCVPAPVRAQAKKIAKGFKRLRKRDQSLGVFDAENFVRQRVTSVVHGAWFERAVHSAIAANFVLLIMYDPTNPEGDWNKKLGYIEFFLLGLFVLEMLCKIVSMGFVFGPDPYLGSGWNILDFIVVVTGCLETIPEVTSMSALRALRALRPLRTLDAFPGMQLLVVTLLESIPLLIDSLLLFLWFFIIFGVIALHSWEGRMTGRCYQPIPELEAEFREQEPGDLSNYFLLAENGEQPCSLSDSPGTNRCNQKLGEVCLDSGRNPNGGYTNYDNFMSAAVTIFQCITFQGWSTIMFQTRDAVGFLPLVIFPLIILCGAYICVQLLLAVIASKFQQNQVLLKNARLLNSNKTKEWKKAQKVWILALIRRTPGLKQLYYYHTTEFSWQPPFKKVVEKKWFGDVVLLLICINTVFMSLEHEGQSDGLTQILETANYIFTAAFTIELVLKMLAYGPIKYWFDSWNRLDGLVVVISLVEFAPIASSGANLSPLRAFRLIKILNSVQSLRQLTKTVVAASGAMTDFLAVLLLFMSVFSLLGMQVFGGMAKFDGKRRNFDTFADGLLTIFEMLTANSWNEVSWNAMDAYGGSWVPAVFCVTWVILGNFCLLSLFVAILIDSISHREDDEEEEEELEMDNWDIKVDGRKLLQAVPEFAHCSDAVLARCCNHMSISRVYAGEVVIRENTTVNNLIIIRQGELRQLMKRAPAAGLEKEESKASLDSQVSSAQRTLEELVHAGQGPAAAGPRSTPPPSPSPMLVTSPTTKDQYSHSFGEGAVIGSECLTTVGHTYTTSIVAATDGIILKLSAANMQNVLDESAMARQELRDMYNAYQDSLNNYQRLFNSEVDRITRFLGDTGLSWQEGSSDGGSDHEEEDEEPGVIKPGQLGYRTKAAKRASFWSKSRRRGTGALSSISKRISRVFSFSSKADPVVPMNQPRASADGSDPTPGSKLNKSKSLDAQAERELTPADEMLEGSVPSFSSAKENDHPKAEDPLRPFAQDSASSAIIYAEPGPSKIEGSVSSQSNSLACESSSASIPQLAARSSGSIALATTSASTKIPPLNTAVIKGEQAVNPFTKGGIFNQPLSKIPPLSPTEEAALSGSRVSPVPAADPLQLDLGTLPAREPSASPGLDGIFDRVCEESPPPPTGNSRPVSEAIEGSASLMDEYIDHSSRPLARAGSLRNGASPRQMSLVPRIASKDMFVPGSVVSMEERPSGSSDLTDQTETDSERAPVCEAIGVPPPTCVAPGSADRYKVSPLALPEKQGDHAAGNGQKGQLKDAAAPGTKEIVAADEAAGVVEESSKDGKNSGSTGNGVNGGSAEDPSTTGVPENGSGGDGQDDPSLTNEGSMWRSVMLKNQMIAAVALGAEAAEDEEEEDDTPEYMRHRALFCLTPTNPLRRLCRAITSHYLFETVVITLILASSVCMALDNPNLDEDSDLKQWLITFDKVFTASFTAELVVKVLTMGFVLHPGSYIRSSWNQLDFFIVLTSLISLMLSSSALKLLKIFRVFRALRPLRMISRLKGMQIVVLCLIHCIPTVSHVGMFGLFEFLIFGLVGVKLFRGKFDYCATAAGLVDRSVQGKDDCVIQYYPNSTDVMLERYWVKPVYNFDNVPISMASLFVVAMGDSWTEVMWSAMDITDVGKQPQQNASVLNSLFFVAFVVLASFFWVNMLVGVVIDYYSRAQDMNGGMMFVTEEQRKWASALQMKRQTSGAIVTKTPTGFRRHLVWLVLHPWFDMIMITAIGINVVLLTTYHYGQPKEWEQFLEAANLVFVIVFALEAAVKLAALLLYDYFRDPWNRFDFLIVVISFVETFAIQSGSVLGTVARIIRIGRIFKALKKARGLRALFNTLVSSLPAIYNVGTLLVLLMFVYATLGMAMYSDIDLGTEYGAINSDLNFHNFPNAMLSLFVFFTGISFMQPLGDCYKRCEDPVTGFASKDPASCEYFPLAIVYFISYYVLAAYILLNVIVAVVLSNFTTSANEEGLLTTDSIFEAIRRKMMLDKFVARMREKTGEYRRIMQMRAALKNKIGRAGSGKQSIVGFWSTMRGNESQRDKEAEKEAQKEVEAETDRSLDAALEESGGVSNGVRDRMRQAEIIRVEKEEAKKRAKEKGGAQAQKKISPKISPRSPRKILGDVPGSVYAHAGTFS